MADIDAELVGGVDIDTTARERFEASFECPIHESLDGLIEVGVDGIIITTPNRYHEEYATTAFDAGLDVLVEKPLAHTLDSAERIVAAADDAAGICMVGFKNRFLPAVEVIKGYADEGRFGDITHVEANYVRRRGIPSNIEGVPLLDSPFIDPDADTDSGIGFRDPKPEHIYRAGTMTTPPSTRARWMGCEQRTST